MECFIDIGISYRSDVYVPQGIQVLYVSRDNRVFVQWYFQFSRHNFKLDQLVKSDMFTVQR